MNITYRFENERNPVKEKEFGRACIELAMKYSEEEINMLHAEKEAKKDSQKKGE